MTTKQLNKSSAARLNFGVLILALTGLGAVYAANLSLDTNTPSKEFSQGSYQIKACDSWISMDLISTSTGAFGAPSGLSALSGITISRLDTKACANTQFNIDIFDSSGQELPAFRTDGIAVLCAAQACDQEGAAQKVIGLKIDATGVVSLIKKDEFHSLSHDEVNATYSVEFSQPSILANDVGRLNIQSGDL